MSAASRPRIRLFIESAGGFTSLEDWISWAQAQIDAQSTAIDDLTRKASEIYRELTAVKSHLQETRTLVEILPGGPDELRRHLDDLDRRLNKILALVDDKLGGGQTEQGMLHHMHAKEYVSLVGQQILALSVGFFRGVPGASPQDKAEFVAFVCAMLFGSQDVREQEIVEALPVNQSVIKHAREICAQARILRGKAAQGRQQRWEFDFTRQAVIEPDWQEPWVGSADDGVVAFVVAPAYVVDSDMLLAKQRVFTVPGTAGSASEEVPDSNEEVPDSNSAHSKPPSVNAKGTHSAG